MTEKPSPLDELRTLQLPERSFMVMGSGILDALHIRQAADVDLVLNDDTYEYLREEGWRDRIASNGAIGIECGVFQGYNRWNDEGVVKTLEELLVDAEWVNGMPFNSLARLSLYKIRRGREKDLADLELIRRYEERTD